MEWIRFSGGDGLSCRVGGRGRGGWGVQVAGGQAVGGGIDPRGSGGSELIDEPRGHGDGEEEEKDALGAEFLEAVASGQLAGGDKIRAEEAQIDGHEDGKEEPVDFAVQRLDVNGKPVQEQDEDEEAEQGLEGEQPEGDAVQGRDAQIELEHEEERDGHGGAG